MIADSMGLQTNAATWLLAIALVAIWIGSIPLILRRRKKRWERLVMSLAGLSWLGFGGGVVLRFFLLSYDSVNFGNLTTRLADRPADVVNGSLIAAGIYWLAFVAGVCVTRMIRIPGVITAWAEGARGLSLIPVPLMVFVSSASVVASSGTMLADALITPVSLVASLWMVPATYAWWRKFSGERVSRALLVVVMLPGVLRVVLSPYREYLLALIFVPLLSAIFAGRRFRLSIVAGLAIAIALASTLVISLYRQVLWMGSSAAEATQAISLSSWQERPTEAPWSENLRRFHAFDSLLLTVDLVPTVFPHTGRDIFAEAISRGLIPRIIYDAKPRSTEGFAFQRTIWGFDNPNGEDAAIAPSMPGNLFLAGGLAFVTAGGFLWALLLGWIDRLKVAVPAGVAVGIHAVFGIQALAGIERDYAHAFSTVLQTLIVTIGVMAVVGIQSSRYRRRPIAAPQKSMVSL